MIRKYVPKGLTFAESFSVMSVNAYYLFFYIETLLLKLRGNDAFLVGNNNYNLLWACLNLTFLVGSLLSVVIKGKVLAVVTFLISFIVSMSFVYVTVTPRVFFKFLLDVFISEESAKLNMYMLTALIVGIVVINKLNETGDYEKLTIRKFFHVLAFLMFTPTVVCNILTRIITVVSYLLYDLKPASGVPNHERQTRGTAERAGENVVNSRNTISQNIGFLEPKVNNVPNIRARIFACVIYISLKRYSLRGDLEDILPLEYSQTRLMVFAFNCVTVLMIYIELARYFLKDQIPFIKNTFDTYFKSFCDEREKAPNAFIITHILLLMGCALPVTSQFIVMRGGFFDKHWAVLAASGLVYLGIGDTAAGIFGKMWGVSRWSDYSKKTTEGTTYMATALFLGQVVLVNVVYPRYNEIVSYKFEELTIQFVIFLFTAIVGAFAEGWTFQYDNLLCTMFYYASLLSAHNYFMHMSYWGGR